MTNTIETLISLEITNKIEKVFNDIIFTQCINTYNYPFDGA